MINTTKGLLKEGPAAAGPLRDSAEAALSEGLERVKSHSILVTTEIGRPSSDRCGGPSAPPSPASRLALVRVVRATEYRRATMMSRADDRHRAVNGAGSVRSKSAQ